MRAQKGFTLLELLMVTAIIGTLASIAIPSYQTYSHRAQFTEALYLGNSARGAIEIAANRGLFDSVNDIDYGRFGIPPLQFGGANNHWLIVLNGNVYVFWKFDGSPLSGVNYILSVTNVEPPLNWEISGSCVNLGYC